MWDGFKTNRSAGKKGYATEGNIDVFIFGKDATRVRFLGEDVRVDEVMAQRKCTKEESIDYVNTSLAYEKWVMPMPVWDHSIPEIAGKRFYSVQPCLGRSACSLCEENMVAKEKGVSENKMLPFPVRKRYVMPAWNYEFKRVLFIKQTEEFFADVQVYLEKNGINSDFDVFKSGEGFNTKYKAIYVGKATEPLPADLVVISFRDIKWSQDKSKISGVKENIPTTGATVGPSGAASTVAAVTSFIENAADFVVSFGSHKGMTLKQLYDAGQLEYLKFLAQNAAGAAQQAAVQFLKEVK